MPDILQYLRSFRQLSHSPDCDGELLQRFRLQRDELAFATIVQRHGPMVLGIARRVLGQSDTAEDVFQATFLVLARRGKHLETWPTVAGWLVQVARRTALQARAKSARRIHHEYQAAAVTTPSPTTDPQQNASQRDLAELLDAELARLPSKYRTPLVLCQLQGQTKEETARQLGWPVGSVSGRLARGKKLLQDRLLRRGFVPAVVAGAFAVRLVAQVPSLLIQATTLLATSVVHQTSKAAASAAMVLAQGVMTSMFLTKLKYAAAVLITIALCLGTGAWALSGNGETAMVQGQIPKVEAKTSTLLEQLQGVWVLEKLHVGRDQQNRYLDVVFKSWEFRGQKYRHYSGNLSPQQEATLVNWGDTFVLNETTQPCQFSDRLNWRGVMKIQDDTLYVNLIPNVVPFKQQDYPKNFEPSDGTIAFTMRRLNDYYRLEGIWRKEERNPVTNEIDSAEELIFKKNMYVRRRFSQTFNNRIQDDKPRVFLLNESATPKQIDLDIRPGEEINAGYANQLSNENDRGGLGRSSFINNTVKKDKILERQVGIYELKENTFTYQISGAIPFKFENERLVPNPQSPLNRRPASFTPGDNATEAFKSISVTYKRVERSLKDGNYAMLRAPGNTDLPLIESKAPTSPQLQDLRQQRLKLAQERLKLWQDARAVGNPSATYEQLESISRQLLDASLTLAQDQDAKVKSMEEHLKVLKQIEVVAEQSYKAGAKTRMDLLGVQAHRIEFEIQLEETKAKK